MQGVQLYMARYAAGIAAELSMSGMRLGGWMELEPILRLSDGCGIHGTSIRTALFPLVIDIDRFLELWKVFLQEIDRHRYLC